MDTFPGDAAALLAAQTATRKAGTIRSRLLMSTLTYILIIVLEAAGSIRGEASAWIPHLLGGRGVIACPHASEEAKVEARRQKEERKSTGKRSRSPCSDTSSDGPKRMKQAPLQIFKGVDMPFRNPAEIEAIQVQATKALIATGSSFGFWENPEVKKTIEMIRGPAADILPTGKRVGGKLLDHCASKAEKKIEEAFKNQDVGLSYV
jgi:hypothetical protein